MWTELLMRQTAAWGPLGWDEVVVGYDFGFLTSGEVRDWARQLEPVHPCGPLEALLSASEHTFEARLWAAAAACTDKAPRPGGRRWAGAQDRWRVALVKEALATAPSSDDLALAVEAIYESVGCPEDMVGLWKAASPWQRQAPLPDPAAIQAFVSRFDPIPSRIA